MTPRSDLGDGGGRGLAEIQGDAQVDGGGVPGIGAVVYHQHVVGGLADTGGEGPGSSSGSEGEDAVGEIVAKMIEIRARHEGETHLAGARRDIEAGGDDGGLLAED